MKSEQLDKFIHKKVRITLHDNTVAEGVLGHGDARFDNKWMGKGYHLYPYNNQSSHSLGFKKSHVKVIEEIP